MSFLNLEAPLLVFSGNNDDGELIGLKDSAKKTFFILYRRRLSSNGQNQYRRCARPVRAKRTDLSSYHLVLHGHTHRETIIKKGNQLTFNPGECAGLMAAALIILV